MTTTNHKLSSPLWFDHQNLCHPNFNWWLFGVLAVFIPRCHCHLWGARLANDIFPLFPFGILPKALKGTKPPVNQRINIFFALSVATHENLDAYHIYLHNIQIRYCIVYIGISWYQLYFLCATKAPKRPSNTPGAPISIFSWKRTSQRGPDLFVASRHSSYMAPRVAAQVVQRAREPFATAEEKALGQQVTRELLGLGRFQLWLRSWGEVWLEFRLYMQRRLLWYLIITIMIYSTIIIVAVIICSIFWNPWSILVDAFFRTGLFLFFL